MQTPMLVHCRGIKLKIIDIHYVYNTHIYLDTHILVQREFKDEFKRETHINNSDIRELFTRIS